MDSHGRAAVVLFRGDPRRDERQKRLPRRFLSTVHAALLKTIAGVAGADILIARDVGREFRLGDRYWQLDSLAGRIEAAIAYGFSRGYSRVLLLAGDIVDLRRDHIAVALQALRAGPAEAPGPASTEAEGLATGDAGRRAVIGFSGDGGFYAAGFSRPPALDWTPLLHDRSNAGAALTEALRAEGFVIATLPTVDDVDGRVDAERVVRLRRTWRDFLRLVAELASMLRAVMIPAPLPLPRRDAAFAFSSTFRGPPPSR